MIPFRSLTFSLLAALAARLPAASLTFDYKDPKEIGAVSLSIDSMLEPIVGYAKGISGTVKFDPAHPERSSGRLAVDVSSIVFANDGYTQTARGYALNEKKYPQLVLTIRKVTKVSSNGKGKFVGEVLADFTCRGITKPKRLAVTASYLPGRAEERTNGQHKGDLLILRTKFSVSRTEHGISTGIPDDMVGDRIDVGVAVVGIHYAAPKPTARWEIEVGYRDDPELVQAERFGDRLSFRASGGTLGAKIVDEKGGKVRFRLDPNPALGEATGEIDRDGFGTLGTKEGSVDLRGRRVAAFAQLVAADPTGSGFEGLGIPDRMKRENAPGLAVARIAKDRVVEVGLYGVRRAGGKEPVVTNTLFQCGSMGRPVLHLTALRMAAAGKLDLARPANAFLGSDTLPERVTVLDLMRGTSGLPFTKFAGYPPSGKVPGLRESLGKLVVDGTTGTAETGSATNDALLELVLEKTGGGTAEALAAEYVFAPLGMRDSTYEPAPRLAAAGYYQGGQPTFDRVHIYPAALESGLWTSIGDFSKLVAELGKLLGGRANALFSEGDRDWLSKVDATKTVLGIQKGENGDYYLGGDPYGFYCQFFMRPAEGEAVVVLQNRMMGWRLTREVADAVRGAR